MRLMLVAPSPPQVLFCFIQLGLFFKTSSTAGLVNALKLIQAIKDKYAGVTYADLFQLASATAVEVLCGASTYQ